MDQNKVDKVKANTSSPYKHITRLCQLDDCMHTIQK